MISYILRRFNLFFFTMLLLSVFAFSLCYLFPGNPLINLTGRFNATPEQLKVLTEQYAFDQNVIWQYFAYLQHIFSGDFGVSLSNQLAIAPTIAKLLPATVELSIVALFLAAIVGIPIGFVAAFYHRKFPDQIMLSFAMIGYSIPVFWLGLFSILVFSINLNWLPSSGNISLVYSIQQVTGIQFIDILVSDSPYRWQAFIDATQHMILPAAVIALAPATVFMRLARNAMLEVLNTNYIRSARAKGLTSSQVIYRHAIRNALVKMVQHVGLQFVHLITMAMITEVIFSWPGIGRWLIQSIYQRDFPAIQGGLLVLSSFIFTVHIIADLLYAAINPLVRGYKRYGS